MSRPAFHPRRRARVGWVRPRVREAGNDVDDVYDPDADDGDDPGSWETVETEYGQGSFGSFPIHVLRAPSGAYYVRPQEFGTLGPFKTLREARLKVWDYLSV
ncbi:MAG: hypothetical protein P3A28_06970 [Gemmatimonadota bacterium]|nr:hypothetical protein [Gemmatimonadota bacterium]